MFIAVCQWYKNCVICFTALCIFSAASNSSIWVEHKAHNSKIEFMNPVREEMYLLIWDKWNLYNDDYNSNLNRIEKDIIVFLAHNGITTNIMSI